MSLPPIPPSLSDRLAYEFRDYGVLRHLWHNLGPVAPGVWRSNQPTAGRLRRLKARLGLRSVVNLRGARQSDPYYRLLSHACAVNGLPLIDVRLHARKAARAEEYLAVIAAFRAAERPFLMHCKSGADRAGMAATLYRLAIEGAPLEEARRELGWRYLHLRGSATGILDHTLDLYAARLARGPIGIEDWLRTEYDPAEATRGFAERRGR
ncbi:tyrosine-protein phosphatase [Wenxinia saemankumensis]|uniref:Tyrosine phosphatase family protein n=1 Tax=Wenxinia saemankumensis TaxID=1447782 RepID=A0A1M6CRV4_9RHOB|nr:tyrosine-protein phosphatase [Wenxinia saemankumensis]SHI63716.1 Tyrosine phosphatase family protein [Wenxinia saemankumensis]